MDFEAINLERERQGRSVFELCRSADVAYSTYWFARTGKTQPRKSTLLKFERALERTPSIPARHR